MPLPSPSVGASSCRWRRWAFTSIASESMMTISGAGQRAPRHRDGRESTMRMMMKAQIDTAAGTKAIQAGRLPEVMRSMMERLKPEAAYFGPDGGQRTAFIIFDMTDP